MQLPRFVFATVCANLLQKVHGKKRPLLSGNFFFNNLRTVSHDAKKKWSARNFVVLSMTEVSVFVQRPREKRGNNMKEGREKGGAMTYKKKKRSSTKMHLLSF